MMFLNLALAGAFAAVAAPILIHIAHRRKAVVVEWGAMRFLIEIMAKSGRRLFIDQWLLLLVRMLAIACFVMALMRPMLRRQGEGREPDALVREGRVAAVLLVDDSLSSGAGRASVVLEEMKELALAYLDTLTPGDEVSLIRQSDLGTPLADPLFDLDAAREWVRRITPTAVASDIPALLEAGEGQLRRHLNPAQELVLLTDGMDQGWARADRARWAAIRQNAPVITDREGTTRRRTRRLLLLHPTTDAPRDNLAITGIATDRTLVPTGQQVSLQIGLRRVGNPERGGVSLRVRVNDEILVERPLETTDAAIWQELVPVTFGESGAHLVDVMLTGGRDTLEADNRRVHVVQAFEQLPILLVEGTAGEGIRGSLGLVELALDPEGRGEGLFRPTRVDVSELIAKDLSQYRAVVLGDLPALDPATLSLLERAVVAGTGILVALGPETNPEHVNSVWAREGGGFLPAALGERHVPEEPLRVESVAPAHPALFAFSGQAAEAWARGRVRVCHTPDLSAVPDGDVTTILRLADGTPLLLERQRGEGRVLLLTTSLTPAWNTLPAEALYVPLVRGVVGYLGSQIQPPLNLQPGTRLIHLPRHHGAPASAETPDGDSLPLALRTWKGREAWVSDPVRGAGAYRVEEGDAPSVWYAFAADPEESELAPLPERDVERTFAGTAHAIFHTAPAIAQALGDAPRTGREIWHWFLLGTVLLLFLESGLTRMQARGTGKDRG